MSDDTTAQPPGTRVVVRFARRAGLAALFVLAALTGSLGGVLFAYADDVSQVSALDDFEPSTITRFLARDGEQVGELATERRVVVTYDQISPALRQAILASEDAGFERHMGVSVTRLAVTVARDLASRRRLRGASTITQQVARMLFLQEYMRGGVFARSGMLGLERKLKEYLLAFQLEKRYTKREIFAFYANNVPLDHGAYGVEAAARMYFGKSAADVTLDEAASIAAIIQTPSRLSPFRNPTQNLSRRNNYVLPRMEDEGFITEAEGVEAAARPLALQPPPSTGSGGAPYFVEDIRRILERRYGADAIYESGLRVQTTLDVRLQQAANAALDRGLRRIDRRWNRYRGPARNVITDGAALEEFSADRWFQPMAAGDIVPALVLAVPERGAARVRIAQHEADLTASSFEGWTGVSPQSFTAGDVIEVALGEMLDDGAPADLRLEQPPEIEGAIVAIDNETGQILAMTGGFDFARSEFNRATQARRQVGALFKTIVDTAAIDRGFTPASVIIDEPTSFEVGPEQPLYEPHNYDREFEGPVTLRHALEDSRNVPAVKLMNEVGATTVVDYAHRFGFGANYQPFLSLALGAGESTLLEITSAYSALPNRGVRMVPYSVVSITDREGNILEEHRPEAREALRADTAFIVTHLLRGVVQRGTGVAASQLQWPLAGKTGTMDEYTDAWFVGFDPRVTVGVWVGYDEKRPLGSSNNGETGASAALPIWVDVMRAYIEAFGDRDAVPTFDAPGNIVFVPLASGQLEAFINGTQPLTPFPGLPEPTPGFADPAGALPAATPTPGPVTDTPPPGPGDSQVLE
jgi:penicillin-binding protein 1A